MRLKSLLTAWFLPPIKVLRLQPGNIQIFFVSWTDGVLLMSHHQALSPTLSTFFCGCFLHLPHFFTDFHIIYLST